MRFELLYALQCRDEAPPPLGTPLPRPDPLQVRILISRLDGASSVRRADPKRCVKAVGVQYNSAIKDLFRDLRRYRERAWIQYTGTDLPATCGGSSCWT